MSEAKEWKRNSLGGTGEAEGASGAGRRNYARSRAKQRTGRKEYRGSPARLKGSCDWTEKYERGTGVVGLTSVPDETEGRNDGDGKKRWRHRGGVW